ncbi:MAG: hypothetical protein ACPGF8_07760 [Opitutales bacterium]
MKSGRIKVWRVAPFDEQILQVKNPDITYDLELLQASQRAWEGNKALRLVYKSLFNAMKAECQGEHILEIGSGIAASRTVFKQLATSDVVKTPYVDLEMSAYEISPPDVGSGWSDIIAMDVMHHLRTPMRFFASAASALEPKGRIVLMEPAASFFGKFFYRWFHHEPIEPNLIVPPFEFPGEGGGYANMGMGVGLFDHHRDAVSAMLAGMGLRVRSVSYRDFMAYPLTGGYSRPQLLPTACVALLLRIESCLPQKLMALLGLRMLIVIEKDENVTSSKKMS